MQVSKQFYFETFYLAYRPNGAFAHPVHGRIQRGQHHALRRRITEGEILDNLLAVLEIYVGAEIQFAGHATILNHGALLTIRVFAIS